MLNSKKINLRQSEIRQSLSELAGKENPTEDGTRSMEALDKEYWQNEIRYRAALILKSANLMRLFPALNCGRLRCIWRKARY